MKRRRYLCVAAFGYALLYTSFYLLNLSAFALKSNEISKPYIWTGWLAFFIFVPLVLLVTYLIWSNLSRKASRAAV